MDARFNLTFTDIYGHGTPCPYPENHTDSAGSALPDDGPVDRFRPATQIFRFRQAARLLSFYPFIFLYLSRQQCRMTALRASSDLLVPLSPPFSFFPFSFYPFIRPYLITLSKSIPIWSNMVIAVPRPAPNTPPPGCWKGPTRYRRSMPGTVFLPSSGVGRWAPNWYR